LSKGDLAVFLELGDAELRRIRDRLRAPGRWTPPSREELEALGLGPRAAPVAAGLAAFDAARASDILGLLLAERERRPPSRLELVWTGPEPEAAESRRTSVVVRRLFERAGKSVLVAGYSFDHGSAILEPLYRAIAERGVRATLFLDIEGTAPSDVEVETFAAARIERFLAENWSFGPPYPVLYYDPRTASPSHHVSLHAKCIVVDEAVTLVTSANFTARGHERNIEVGVLIEDALFARRLVEHWLRLVSLGFVQRYQP